MSCSPRRSCRCSSTMSMPPASISRASTRPVSANEEATFYLGQVEERADHPAAAIDWYVKASGSNRTEAQVRIAVIRAKQGDVARAREILQQLRDQSPGDAETLFLVEAEILDEVGRKEDAMAVYAAALESFPDNADILYARALYAVKVDRVDLAEADLRRVIAARSGARGCLERLRLHPGGSHRPIPGGAGADREGLCR